MAIIESWTKKIIDAGVSEKHIECMKERYLDSLAKYENYYEYEKKEKVLSYVDTSKIEGICTSWSTSGRSVYDLFFSVTGELEDNEAQSMHGGRIQTNYDSLVNNGIDYQYNFYVNDELDDVLRDGLPVFYHLVEDDIYFSCATHRTISALMFNAPKMVGYVSEMRINKEKSKNYSEYLRINDGWQHFINNLYSLSICRKKNDRKINKLSVYFKEFLEEELFTFESPLKSSSDMEFSDNRDTISYGELVADYIEKIGDIDDALFEHTFTDEIKGFVLNIFSRSKVFMFIFSEIYSRNKKYIFIYNSSEEIIMKLKKKRTLERLYKSHFDRMEKLNE